MSTEPRPAEPRSGEKPDPWAPYEPSLWGTRARHLVEQALSEVTDGIDAIGTLEAAIAALRIEAGELPASEMDGYPFPGEPVDDESRCICPSDLLERGGHRGGCPVHSLAPPPGIRL